MLKRIIAGLALLFGILLLTLPRTDEKSVTKMASGSILMCTSELRQQVEAQVVRGEAVSVAFRNKCPELIAAVEVKETGEVTITGNKYPMTMALHPVMENGGVRWSCRGEPAASISKLCKP